MNRRSCVKLLVFGCVMCQFAAYSWAQSYPARVVRVVVASSAGSGMDILGRILAGGLTEVFGQQVIVDNRAGAGGNIGTGIAAKAPPDGYTLFLVNVGHAANVVLYRNLPFDLTRDFAPVTQLASSPVLVVVHPSLPVKSIGELVKLAKARPGAINYASAGLGTPTFIPAELFKGQAGVDLLHVPYQGGGPALTAVLAGETSVYFAPVATALPHIRSGRLRSLAVTSAKRVPLLPEYPTIAESGYPGYQFGNWHGILVPVKTPKETIATIRSAAISVLNKPEISKRLIELGYVLIGDQPEEFAAHIKSEIAKLAKVIQQTGATDY